MKKILKISVTLLSIVAFMLACQEEDKDFGDITIPSNLMLDFEIQGVDDMNPNGDGSGFVTFTASADNAITYRFNFGDNSAVEVAPSGEVTHRFTQSGVNSYTVTAIASGTGGLTTSTAVSVTVFSAFDDQEAKELLSGGLGSSKIWYPKLDQNGHLGVGPTLEQDLADDGGLNGHWFPQYNSTNAFGKCGEDASDCFCEFTVSFTLSADNELSYIQNNNGQTFFNWAHGAVVGQEFGQFEDTCFAFDTSGVSDVSFAPSETDWSQIQDPDFPEPRGTVMNFTNDAFMGYYTGVSSYEILTIEEDFLYVRFYDNVNPVLAWYQMFTTTNPNGLAGDCSGETGETGLGNNDILVWSDEFDTDGAPCGENWSYEIGTGNNGWGNGEAQYYTDRAEKCYSRRWKT
ncbi:PKD domain-containing protein [Lacinutrix salivirga]